MITKETIVQKLQAMGVHVDDVMLTAADQFEALGKDLQACENPEQVEAALAEADANPVLVEEIRRLSHNNQVFATWRDLLLVFIKDTHEILQTLKERLQEVTVLEEVPNDPLLVSVNSTED